MMFNKGKVGSDNVNVAEMDKEPGLGAISVVEGGSQSPDSSQGDPRNYSALLER